MSVKLIHVSAEEIAGLLLLSIFSLMRHTSLNGNLDLSCLLGEG